MTEITNIKSVKLPDGSTMSALGQGTWLMAEDDEKRQQEIDGLRYGISLGIKLIDTAEMYADGKAEALAGDAVRGLDRDDFYIVSKVYPQNAGRKHIYSSINRSLKLLGADHLDMYLLHWREDADLAEVAYCMEDLKDKGLIRRWGVSNFDVDDMEDLWKVPDGNRCCINQILYNLATRGIEFDLMQWQREHGVPMMAYGPVGRAGALVTQDGVSKAQLMSDHNVIEVAERLGISVIQLLLAFVLRHDDMVAIPKAVGFGHIQENLHALDVNLSSDDIAQLSESFPAPTRKIEMEKY